MNKHKLFVYGTLRKGGANDITKLYPTAVFAGLATVRGLLYDMGDYPAIILDDRADPIAGEIYDIADATLSQLDLFEIDAGYRRMQIEISPSGVTTMCWIFGPDADLCAGKPEIVSGDWIEYQAGLK